MPLPGTGAEVAYFSWRPSWVCPLWQTSAKRNSIKALHVRSGRVVLSDRTTRCSPFQVSEGPSSLSRCIQCGPDATSFPAEEEKQEVRERDYLVIDGREDKELNHPCFSVSAIPHISHPFPTPSLSCPKRDVLPPSVSLCVYVCVCVRACAQMRKKVW